MRSFLFIFFSLVLLLMSGCIGSRISANVQHFNDPSYDQSLIKKFDILPIKKDGSLEEKTYLGYIKEVLIKKGFTYTPKNPDFHVVVKYGSSVEMMNTAPTTYYTSHYNPGTTSYHTGTVGGTSYSGTSTSTGTITQQAHTIGGGTVRANNRVMSIEFVDAKKLIESKELSLIWEGRVESQGSSVLAQVAKCLIQVTLEDYPAKPEKSKKKICGKAFDECYQE